MGALEHLENPDFNLEDYKKIGDEISKKPSVHSSPEINEYDEKDVKKEIIKVGEKVFREQLVSVRIEKKNSDSDNEHEKIIEKKEEQMPETKIIQNKELIKLSEEIEEGLKEEEKKMVKKNNDYVLPSDFFFRKMIVEQLFSGKEIFNVKKITDDEEIRKKINNLWKMISGTVKGFVENNGDVSVAEVIMCVQLWKNVLKNILGEQ